MKILLVNDDGYNANGIKELKKILVNYGEVYTVAPYKGMSGAGCGLTTYKPFKVHKVSETDFMVEGTPVDCVIFAVAYFGKIFDLVVSGCNYGFNISHDILYSGTCGAGYQGLMQGFPTIVFSEDRKEDMWEVRKWGKEVLDFIFDKKLLSKDYFINVNFPKMEFTEAKGIKITKLYIRDTVYEIESVDGLDYMIKHTHDDPNEPIEYDVPAVRSGYISITPMSVTTFKEEQYNEVINKLK